MKTGFTGAVMMGLVSGLLRAAQGAQDGAAAGIEACNVVWNSPGKSSADSMPLGNGVLGINLWVEGNGDLLFYLGRNDTHSEVGQLCKAGKVRVSLVPNPFKAGAPFRQELKLRDGVCEIVAGDVRLKVFVDAAQPVVHVTGESATPVSVTAKVESWRTQKQRPKNQVTWWTMQGASNEIWQAADVFPQAREDSVAWYHRNDESIAFESTVKVQSLETIRRTMRDPLLNRTFGGWVTGAGFKATDDRTLSTTAPVNVFDLRVASPCAQTATGAEWLSIAEESAKQSADAKAAFERTVASWRTFWERSWVNCGVQASQPVPTNTQPLRVGPNPTANPQPSMQVSQPVITGRVLPEADILAHAQQQPQTQAISEVSVPLCESGITFEAWIKRDPGPPTNFRIMEKRIGTELDGFYFGTYRDRIMISVGNLEHYAPRNALTHGKWQHVAATYEACSAVFSLYVDGNLVGRSGSENMTVGKAYVLHRYMQGCAGRGLYPIKFNGSIFTVDPAPMGKNENPDWRSWGEGFWWQNTRLPIHAMLGSGDFELMMPLFNMYESFRPLAEARSKLYHGAEGACFAECSTPWGTYSNAEYGWNRDGLKPGEVKCLWWRYAWNQGPELVSLMLDYYDFTEDKAFLKDRLLPMATSVLKYFDTRFRKDAAGRIVVDPAQVLETYWDGVVNDTPTVAGLNAVPLRLCSLPSTAMSAEQRRFFEHMKAAAPVIPMESVKFNGKETQRIRAAEKFNPKRTNGENGDLYAVWPFGLFGLKRPLLEEARNTFAMRGARSRGGGWNYDFNAAALLGLTEEVAGNVKNRIANSNGLYRWPATWGPNADWLPDHCHGGNLMFAINNMLVQGVGEKILLLPAWPKDWDVSFKLHAPRQTTVEATVQGGKVIGLKVVPESRRKDVELNPEFKLTM
jgi:hypothetical protein